MPLSIVAADKGYDSEANHGFVREHLGAVSISLLDMEMYQYGERMEGTGSRWRGDSIHVYTIKGTRTKPYCLW